MQALQARFSPETLCVEQQSEVMRLHRRLRKKLNCKQQRQLLEVADAEARLRTDVSLESFIAGFRLDCGIAHELGAEVLLLPPGGAADQQSIGQERAFLKTAA